MPVLTNADRVASSSITGRGSQIINPAMGAIRLASGATVLNSPANLFKTYLIKNSPTGATNGSNLGVQPMDNLTMNNSLNIMYGFAQTTMSMLPMLIQRTIDLPSGRGDYTRHGDVDLRVKTQEAAKTPGTSIQFDRREIQEAIMEQGFIEGLDVSRRGIMRVTSLFQESVAHAIARNMDKWVQIACTDDVGVKSSIVNDSYYGNNTYTTTKFPDKNRFVRTNGQAGSASNVASIAPDPAKLATATKNLVAGEKFLDDLKEVLTYKNLNPAEVVVIGSRNLEKQIQQIVAFRNIDNTLSMKKAYSYTGDLWWHGLNFVFLNQDCYINGKEQFKSKRFDVAGKIVTTGGVVLNANAAQGNLANAETFLIVHMSGLIRGLTHANFTANSIRPDFSYASQIYVKVGAAFSRIDDDKVIQVLYQKSSNSLVA